MGTASRLVNAWREFKKGTPGRRFQDHYCRKHDARAGNARRLAFIVGGIGLMALGAASSIFPWMPGSMLIGIGALVLCAESRTAARAVDSVEVRSRSTMSRVRRAVRQLRAR
jgi:hypothetical protein